MDSAKFHEKYYKISEEVKNKQQQYCRDRYENLSEDEKQKLVEHRKRDYNKWKNKIASYIKTE